MPGLILAEGLLSSGLDRQSQEGLLGEGSERAGNPKMQFTPQNGKERWGFLQGGEKFSPTFTPFDLCATAGERRNK